MWLSRYSLSHNLIFGIFVIIVLVLNSLLLIEGCHENQKCYTPQNFEGYYYSMEYMQRLSDSQRSGCEGSCTDNSTTLICCSFRHKPAKHRLLYQSCLDDHLPFAFITFGVVAKPNEFPFMAAVGWRVRKEDGTETISYRCGGTLIDSRYVLTAAHCLYHSSDPPVVVRPGGYDLNSTTATDYEIDQIIEHPNYEYPGLYNDIAIIRMTSEFYRGATVVARACIWYGPVAEEEQVTAIGYGDTQFAGSSSPLLMKATLSAITNEECSLYYEPDDDSLSAGVASTQLCAKDHEKLRDTCQGDSGGPLIRYEQIEGYLQVAFLVGITSFGIGCGTGMPGLYTRVSEYYDWIEEKVYK